MLELRSNHIFLSAVFLLGFTASTHVALGTGIIVADGSQELAPLFILGGVVTFVLLGLLISEIVPRKAIYDIGLLLMGVQLLVYIDWHILQLLDGIVSTAYGHTHDHGFRHRELTILTEQDLLTAIPLVSAAADLALHLFTSPLDLVTKMAEVVLIPLLLILRWMEVQRLRQVRWRPRLADIRNALIALVVGFGGCLVVLLSGETLLALGLEGAFVDLLELTLVLVTLVSVSWFIVGKPLLESTTSTAHISAARWIPGFESGEWIDNLAVGVVYGVAFLALAALIVTALSVGGADHAHDHTSPELDSLATAVEEEGISVDRDWTMIHYSNHYGGDALLFDYFTNHENDSEGLESEIAQITEVYVDHVVDGDFDEIVVFFGEARTQGDEAHLYWEVEQAWIESYLAEEWTWEELLAEITETIEAAADRDFS